MSSTAIKQQGIVSGTNTDRIRQDQLLWSPRNRRTLLGTVNRFMDRMLTLRQFIRAGFVLLPLTAFLYISHLNQVQNPFRETPEANSSQLSSNETSGLAGSNAELLKQTSIGNVPATMRQPDAADHAPLATFETPIASAWSSVDLGSSGLVPDGADSEPRSSGFVGQVRNVDATGIYTVNDGGSLWRTGRRFLDDEILLDKLIDNLEESGMNVRRVNAGVEFVVNDLGKDGLLVIIENGGEIYESHILADSVTTSIQREAEVGNDSSYTAWLRL